MYSAQPLRITGKAHQKCTLTSIVRYSPLAGESKPAYSARLAADKRSARGDVGEWLKPVPC